MDTSEVQVLVWMRSSEADGSAWNVRAWKRGRRGADDPNGMQGRHIVHEEAADDHERGAQLQAQHADAAAAAAAAREAQANVEAIQQQQRTQPQGGAPPTPTAADHARATLERRKEEVWHAAQDEGADITLDQILAMDAEELERWAEAHIQGL